MWHSDHFSPFGHFSTLTNEAMRQRGNEAMMQHTPFPDFGQLAQFGQFIQRGMFWSCFGRVGTYMDDRSRQVSV